MEKHAKFICHHFDKVLWGKAGLYNWASQVAHWVKMPAIQETPEMQVRSLDGEDPLEEGMATRFSILAWRIPMDRGAWRATVPGVAKNQE